MVVQQRHLKKAVAAMERMGLTLPQRRKGSLVLITQAEEAEAVSHLRLGLHQEQAAPVS